MGRQFRYYCLERDLADIQHQVFVPAGGQLVISENCDGMHRMLPINKFALERNRMGHEPIQLLLLPPLEMQREVLNGEWIDTSKSHVIEVNRCYTDGKLIRLARFWYETKYFVGTEPYTKPNEFVEWAECIFRKTKQLLRRHEFNYGGYTDTEWFGSQAWTEVSRGNLEPIQN